VNATGLVGSVIVQGAGEDPAAGAALIVRRQVVDVKPDIVWLFIHPDVSPAGLACGHVVVTDEQQLPECVSERLYAVLRAACDIELR
jgi:hypothetical protein